MKTKKEVSPHCSEKAPATFCDVAACFSEEEWQLLHEWQKDVYRTVMKEIHQALLSLGPVIATSVFSLRSKGQEQLYPTDQRESERRPSDSDSPSHVITIPAASKTTKERDHVYPSNHQESEGRHRNNNSARIGCRAPEVPQPVPALVLSNHAGPLEEDTAGHPRPQTREVLGLESIKPIVFVGLNKEEKNNASGFCDFERQEKNRMVSRLSSLNIETEETFMDHSGTGRDASSTSLCPGVNKAVVHTEQHLESSLENTSTISECGRSFSFKSNVNKHPRIKLEESLHACTEYSSSMNEQSHFIKHKDNKQECNLYTKTEFGMSFSDSATLNSPPKLSSTLEMYICGLCGNSFHQHADKTLQHQNDKGEPQNICSECEKSLQQSTNLHSDQGNYMGGKPYPCTECGKCFRKSQSLIIHQRVHTGEKPYTCSQCGKTFRQLPHLVKHQRLHTGEKPYMCNVCERRFIDSSNLKRHEQIHIRELEIMTWPIEG